jgi:hypothetical protein
MENHGLHLVREIISSPAFQSYNTKQQREVLEQVIATGEVSTEIVMNIYNLSNISYLESLPYNVFMKIVLAGEIVDKDLIRLCNSSPILNSYCNKDFVRSDDVVLNKYLFRVLLAKMGIDVPVNVDARAYYKYFLNNWTVYKSLIDKLHRVVEIENTLYEGVEYSQRLNYPHDLYLLLYRSDQNSFGLLQHEINKQGFNIENLYRLVDDLGDIIYNNNDLEKINEFENMKFTYENVINLLGKPVKELEKVPKNWLELFRNNLEPFNLTTRINRNRAREWEPDFLNTNGKAAEYSMYLQDHWSGQLPNDFSEEDEDEINAINEKRYEFFSRLLEELRQIKLTDEEELFLIGLHERVRSGNLPVNTLFRFEDLIYDF